MPDDIEAKDLSAEVRANATQLLQNKMRQPYETVEDLIDQLQLLLICDGPGSQQVANRAGRRIHSAIHTLTHTGESDEMFEAYGWRPSEHLLKGFNARVTFYPLHQRTLPLCSSDMSFPEQRRKIVRSALAEVRGQSADLRRLFLGVKGAHLRRIKLRKYFRRLRILKNRGQILVNVIHYAARQVRYTQSPANLMMGDLFAVVIGDDMLNGRLSGQYFGTNIKGSSGLKPQYRDSFNQIQHAVAGLVIGHRMGFLGALAAEMLEYFKNQPQDVNLYDAAYWVSRDLSDQNYLALSERVRRSICDESVNPAPPLP